MLFDSVVCLRVGVFVTCVHWLRLFVGVARLLACVVCLVVCSFVCL